MFGKYENINYIIMIVTQDLVCNSILSLHLAMGRGVVSLVIMVSLARMVSLASMVCLDLFRKVKCINFIGPNVSSSHCENLQVSYYYCYGNISGMAIVNFLSRKMSGKSHVSKDLILFSQK